jgi:7-carboxy-7-deazaguanine synthase (Cx14CxxC type)
MYYTLQGEGAHTGRPSVFVRFAGCNLWSGREIDREKAVCKFCDTQFVGTDGPGGGKFQNASALADAVRDLWPDHTKDAGKPYVVCTGGEPLLQLDTAAIGAMQERGFEVGVETNGTIAAPPEVDWVCVSPKAGASLVQVNGDELKLVYPQTESEAKPEKFQHLKFDNFFLQPLDSSEYEANLRRTIEYCLSNPMWRLSVQTHKILGIN